MVVNDGVPEGRVGRVSRGRWSDYLVVLERHTDSPRSWLLLWRDPTRSLDTPGAVGDVAGDRVVPDSTELTNLLEDLGVEWLPETAHQDAIDRYFSFPEPAPQSSRKKRRG